MRRMLALALAMGSPAAAAQCYAVDAAGGRVSFEVEQAGSPFRGGFRRFGGELCLEQGRVARIEVWLDPASVRAGLPEIEAALKEKEFFAVAEHPRIRFASNSVAARGESQLARGTLEIKGTRREVEVAFGMRETNGKPSVSGVFALNRLDYGIGTGEWSDTRWLGAGVKVEFSAALSR